VKQRREHQGQQQEGVDRPPILEKEVPSSPRLPPIILPLAPVTPPLAPVIPPACPLTGFSLSFLVKKRAESWHRYLGIKNLLRSTSRDSGKSLKMPTESSIVVTEKSKELLIVPFTAPLTANRGQTSYTTISLPFFDTNHPLVPHHRRHPKSSPFLRPTACLWLPMGLGDSPVEP